MPEEALDYEMRDSLDVGRRPSWVDVSASESSRERQSWDTPLFPRTPVPRQSLSERRNLNLASLTVSASEIEPLVDTFFPS